MSNEVLQVNWRLFEVLNLPAGHEGALDPLMIFGANDVIALMPLLVLALWFGLARWSPLARLLAAGSGQDKARAEGQRMALLACVAVGIALALNVAIGHIVREPRPFISHPGVVHQLIAHAADNSFPSDHEAVAGAVTTVLVLYMLALRSTAGAAVPQPGTRSAWLALATPLALVALVALVWIGVARIYVGVHYPGDIAAGAGCGLVGGMLATALRPIASSVFDPLIRLAERLRLA